MEISGEAQFETKVVLTWGSARVVSTGEHALPWSRGPGGATRVMARPFAGKARRDL